MAAKKRGDSNPERQNQKNAKAWKKRPLKFDPIKRRLVRA
jgi:hypothetical protein